MRTSILRILLPVFALVFVVSACTTPRQPPMPVGNLKLGVAFFTQPQETGDLFAGYMTEHNDTVDQKVLGELDLLMANTLGVKSSHQYTSAAVAVECAQSLGEAYTRRQAAIRKWSAIGRCMGVDLLLVPQLLEWRERDGGEYGVTRPAGVVMDIYLINVNEESLISRSRYDETQSALTANLLDTGKFFKRGGKWVQAIDLAEEGIEKAVREMGL